MQRPSVLDPDGNEGTSSLSKGRYLLAMTSASPLLTPPQPSRCASAPCTPKPSDPPRISSAFEKLCRSSTLRAHGTSFWTLLLLLGCLLSTASAVMIPFDNCLDDSFLYPKSEAERPLQWTPLYVDASYNTTDERHVLFVRVWGNVSGHFYEDEVLPNANSSDWTNPNVTVGKILDDPEPDAEDRLLTTLFSKINILTYEPWHDATRFCQSLTNGTCPLGPVFNESGLELPYDLPSFNLSNAFYSSYALTSLSSTFFVRYAQQTTIGCVSTTVTPDIGDLAWLFKFLPAIVLMFVGFATAFAAILSPWGSTDPFHWTSNYGRDPDLLRLITPGFGDCLQYIQFAVLSGSLTLNYPGFFQPIISQASWSTLMFNQSFVSHDDGWQNVVDGIYVTNGTYGLHKLGQLVGMTDAQDIWAGMIIWVLVTIGGTFILIQSGFAIQWIYRWVSKIPEEDLRKKNIPFSLGNVIRIVFNYFLLPIVALSAFQLVVAGSSPTATVALAVVTLVVIISFAGWLLYFIATTKPRSILFDDLPKVLLYGPLYNTFSDEAAAFALIPVLLVFVRGIAIGAVQPSGVAQLVILAICEVIQIITLHAFRPFHSPTSMNAYHTLFAILRFSAIMLMVAFAPTLGVMEGTRGWIGYAILVIHAVVLIFGFFLNALQTIVEVVARLLGVGGDDDQGQTRGGLSKIFGMRQLQRRVPPRAAGPSRQSQLSSAAMLHSDKVSNQGYPMPNGRVRSESAGSIGQMLIGPHHRSSSVLDSNSIEAYSVPTAPSAFTPTTPGEASTFSFLPSPGAKGTRPPPAAVTMESADPWYRPPRKRKSTLEGGTPGDRSRTSWASDNMIGRRFSRSAGPAAEAAELDGGISRSVTPAPYTHPTIDPAPQTDYSTREIDFYYGVRGQKLNSEGPGRKLGTGPADPTSPMSSAAGWVRSLFGGKIKEKSKGFEVVRSSRMPPAMRAGGGDYDDGGPAGIPVAMNTIRNPGPIDSDDEDDVPKRKKEISIGKKPDALLTEDGTPREDSIDESMVGRSSNAAAPSLPGIDPVGSIHMPSRVQSKASKVPASRQPSKTGSVARSEVPSIPRKSSKRHPDDRYDHSRTPSFNLIPPKDVSDGLPSPYRGYVDDMNRLSSMHSRNDSAGSTRLPFQRTNSQKRFSSGSSAGYTEGFSDVDISFKDDRPGSLGCVSQHSINRVDPDTSRQRELIGATAEVIDSNGRGGGYPYTRR
ncbi:hypothetical protein MKZ38_008596 [Zalerion maritima]|uniref:ML-like domain-containing protein n=1 Tax=Zalerion maritima TaxID=339359 RepID=A0AAD5S0I0_9PEZI|nr:hypothetical protein MKZ38_008596 [Zalerion maritima]